VMAVYNKYIKGENFIATSMVPKGQMAQALEGSLKADVVEEKIVQGAEETFDATIQAEYERTPSSFDRSVEPPYGEAPEVVIPKVWKADLNNGMKVLGIENDEVPLVQFNISIEGGLLLDDINKVGVANLTANLMTQGTQRKSPKELEEAIAQLGATLNISASTERITITGNTLAKNYQQTMDLVEEMLLEPRWDEQEFTLRKQSVISAIKQQEANPNAIASNAYDILIYGQNNIRSKNILGSESSVEGISIEDLKNYYAKYISPSVATMHVVGDISEEAVMSSLNDLQSKWKAKAVEIPVYNTPKAPDNHKSSSMMCPMQSNLYST